MQWRKVPGVYYMHVYMDTSEYFTHVHMHLNIHTHTEKLCSFSVPHFVSDPPSIVSLVFLFYHWGLRVPETPPVPGKLRHWLLPISFSTVKKQGRHGAVRFITWSCYKAMRAECWGSAGSTLASVPVAQFREQNWFLPQICGTMVKWRTRSLAYFSGYA